LTPATIVLSGAAAMRVTLLRGSERVPLAVPRAYPIVLGVGDALEVVSSHVVTVRTIPARP
jgi:hypothetical protein